MADGEVQAGPGDNDGATSPLPPCGATSETAGAADPTPGRMPATLYGRWRTAFHVDGVAYGKRVRELRDERGWTQKDLRDRTGIPITTISELESGETARPQVALSMTLAQTFGFEHPGDLLGLAQPPRPPGTHPAGPRSHPAAAAPAEGPGAMTLDALVASLLRGVWAAQGTRPASEPLGVADVAVTPLAGAEAAPAVDSLRALGGTPVFVGAVFLVAPKTLG